MTDRCNLRCRYCMPEGIRLTSSDEILTLEEIELICKAAVRMGITRFKITGGEPLVRLGCPELIGMIKRIPGVEQVTLTTNGVLLGKYLDRLLENGLDAVNISLDTLHPSVYRQLTGYDKFGEVWENLERAVQTGMSVKVNSVLQKGVNEEEWEPLAALTFKEKVDVRFIEMMPIGYGRQYEGISGEELLCRLMERYPGMERDESVHGNGPAVYYRIPGALGSVGFISAVHGQFCDACNRIRLTAKGELKPCLCYRESIMVKDIIRGDVDGAGLASEDADVGTAAIKRLEEAIGEAVKKKPQMHCFGTCGKITENRQMVQIGG